MDPGIPRQAALCNSSVYQVKGDDFRHACNAGRLRPILIIQYPACAVFNRICMAGGYPYRFPDGCALHSLLPCPCIISVSSLGIIHKTDGKKDSSHAEYGRCKPFHDGSAADHGNASRIIVSHLG